MDRANDEAAGHPSERVGEGSENAAITSSTSESPSSVEGLKPGMTGRWEVHTRKSTHVWDLDALTYTRLPGEDSTPMSYDAQPMPITHVERWPAVGAQSMVLFDDPVDGTLEHWRICSTIRRIVPATDSSDPNSSDSRTFRFHRCLTDAELASVIAASREGGVRSGMPALWDVILHEAEGVTWVEANERGQQFEPGRYAIPAQQADAVRKALEEHDPGLRNVGYAVAMAWLDIGPATF